MASKGWGMFAGFAVASLLGGAPHASATPLAQQPAPRTHLLIVAGIGGESTYRDAFHNTALAMAEAATGRLGLSDSSVIVLTEDPARTPDRIHGRSTHEEIARALHRLASRAGPDDQLVILLVGHGASQGDDPRFNLPGPDLSAATLAQALAPFAGRRIAVINTASASGGFVEALAAPKRIVITATKSGFERNATIFGTHFVEAFTGDGADSDKNERISLLEAFTYATREVARAYESDNRLLTEHARLGGDTTLARQFFIGGGTPAGKAARTPAMVALHARRDSLERQLQTLRGAKATLDDAAYERRLETLLLEIARTGQAIRNAEGTP